jgi:hypothetical protein
MVTSARLSAPGLAHAPLHEERYAPVAARSLLARAPLRRPADAAAHVLLDAHADLPLFRYFIDARPSRESWAFRHVQLLGRIGAIRACRARGRGRGGAAAVLCAARPRAAPPRAAVRKRAHGERPLPAVVARRARIRARAVALAAELAACPLR